MYNFKLLLLGLLVTMFMQCNDSAKIKTTTEPSAKNAKTTVGPSAKNAKKEKDAPETAMDPKEQEELLKDYDKSPNKMQFLKDYDDEVLEALFQNCLQQHGTSMEKYDKQLEKCSKDLKDKDPTKMKKWVKDNCKHIEDTGFPACYNRTYNKIFNSCYNEFPYNSDMIVESMRLKYKLICDVPITA